MKILFFGDSITDAARNKSAAIGDVESYGVGYVNLIAKALFAKDNEKYTVINRGNNGHRIVDLYARIKMDVWEHKPDVLSILVGVNDVWHEIIEKNGVDLIRFERMYRMMLQDTIERLPNVKLILCEPFVLEGPSTKDRMQEFLEVKKYAKVVKEIAKDFNADFLPLQEDFEKGAEKHGAEYYLSDGVHPHVAGAQLIAEKWLKLYQEKIER